MEELILWLVENPLLWIGGLFLAIVGINLVRSIRIVPPQTVQVVERSREVRADPELWISIVLVPFIEKVRYKHSLKEVAIDVPAQSCFTEDNVRFASTASST
jgi:regulator of protease activity HflC (stomatin/prohibitin superfamily)